MTTQENGHLVELTPWASSKQTKGGNGIQTHFPFFSFTTFTTLFYDAELHLMQPLPSEATQMMQVREKAPQ